MLALAAVTINTITPTTAIAGTFIFFYPISFIVSITIKLSIASVAVILYLMSISF